MRKHGARMMRYKLAAVRAIALGTIVVIVGCMAVGLPGCGVKSAPSRPSMPRRNASWTCAASVRSRWYQADLDAPEPLRRRTFDARPGRIRHQARRWGRAVQSHWSKSR